MAQYPKFGLGATVTKISHRQRSESEVPPQFNKTQGDLKSPSRQEVVVYMGQPGSPVATTAAMIKPSQSVMNRQSVPISLQQLH